jgi:hypothetical protein
MKLHLISLFIGFNITAYGVEDEKNIFPIYTYTNKEQIKESRVIAESFNRIRIGQQYESITNLFGNPSFKSPVREIDLESDKIKEPKEWQVVYRHKSLDFICYRLLFSMEGKKPGKLLSVFIFYKKESRPIEIGELKICVL